MTEQGANIVKLCNGMLQLNLEIASLIKTTDNWLSNKDFDHEKTTGVSKGSSDSLDNPERWTRLKMYRRYQNKKDRDDVIVLNIRLVKPGEPELVPEPLVLFGRFQYQKGQAVKCWGEWDSWDLWRHKAATEINHLYVKKDLRLEDAHFLEESEWEINEVKAMREIRFIAVLLASITDSKVLFRDVLARVL